MFIVLQVGKYDVASDIELVLYGYEFIDDKSHLTYHICIKNKIFNKLSYSLTVHKILFQNRSNIILILVY